MNIHDRRRAANLIEGEFRQRRMQVRETFTDDEIAAKAQDIAKRAKLDKQIERLVKLRSEVEQLEKQLAESVAKLPGAKAKKKYRNGCECLPAYSETLTQVAKDRLEQDLGHEAAIASLDAQQRKLLAAVEVAQSTDDIRKVLAAAGLV